MNDSDVERLTAQVRSDLGSLPTGAGDGYGYPKSLALCIIDSIQSLRLNYASVTRVVDSYRSYRSDSGADADTDGVAELLTSFQELGGAEAWSKRIGTANVSPGTHTLKAATMEVAAQKLQILRIDTTDHLRLAASDPSRLAAVKDAWLGTKGLGPASWDYVLMLSGEDGVKSDVWVVRYVSRALDRTTLLDPRSARDLVSAVADNLGVMRRTLDHAIWRFESGRASVDR